MAGNSQIRRSGLAGFFAAVKMASQFFTRELLFAILQNLKPLLAGFFAILITASLFFTKAPPFSILLPQAADTSGEGVTIESSGSPTELGGPIILFVPETFDHIIEADRGKMVMKAGANSWSKKISLFNQSPDSAVNIYFFVRGVDTCDENHSTNCAKYEPQHTLEANSNAAIEVEFIDILLKGNAPLEGQFIVVWGETAKNYRFSVEGEWQKQPISYTQKAASFSQTFLELGLALLTGAVLYAILLLRIFPRLASEKSQLFSKDSDDSNKNLWSAFSTRSEELREHSRGLSPIDSSLINPTIGFGSNIDLPGSLDKEESILKSIVELMAWVLPARGISIRLDKVQASSDEAGGISVTLVQNSDRQTLAEKTFFAQDYGLDSGAKNVDNLLMTPIVSWIMDWREMKYRVSSGSREMSDFKKRKANVYCDLGCRLWSENWEIGKRLYMRALSYDPRNLKAHAGLGRIWLENAWPELAIAHLEEVTRNREPSKNKIEKTENSIDKMDGKSNKLWFSAKYNLAVARLARNDDSAVTDALKEYDELEREVKSLLDAAHLDNESSRLGHDFNHWLNRFQCMALIFNHSLLLEQTPPEREQQLDVMIAQMLHDVMKTKFYSDVKARSAPPPVRWISSNPQSWLLVTLDYRSQYNAACYFSRCYYHAKSISDKENIPDPVQRFPNKEKYADHALNYLQLALGHGGGLAKYACKDTALVAVRSHRQADFNGIIQSLDLVLANESGKKQEDEAAEEDDEK
jgi:hypothetical protein